MKEKPGALLRKTRESRGLTQDDVVKRLRLKLRIIEDIENDHYENISATVYMRGYLRAYSRMLGLKEDEVLQAFSELQIADPNRMVHDRHIQVNNHEEIAENPSSWLRWSLLGLLGFLIFAALFVWWNQPKTPRKEASLPVSTLPQTALIIPANPDTAETPAVKNVPTDAVAENKTPVVGDAAEANSSLAEKPQEKVIHPKPHHYRHKVAHKILKPNYTLSPVTEPATN
jgi:cytoskeleton protein RodZ